MASKKQNRKTQVTYKKETMTLPSVMQALASEVTVMAFRLRGDVLLVHQWGQKSVIEMLGKMSGHDMPQLDKDLIEEGLASAYRNENGVDVLPCRIIKACFVNGASATRGAVKAHELNKHLRVMGHTAPLQFESVDRCNTETVKVGPWNDRSVDLRARTAYYNWSCDIAVRFPHAIVGKEKIGTAMQAAGMFVGLCEKRIEKGFDLGGFEVEGLPADMIDGIIEANNVPEKHYVIPQELLRAASAKLEGVDKRNPKKKMVAVVNGVNEAPERHAADEANEADSDRDDDEEDAA